MLYSRHSSAEHMLLHAPCVSQHLQQLGKRLCCMMQTMDRGTLAKLSQLMREAQAGVAARGRTIVVCHSSPLAWSLPEAGFQTSECPPSGLERLYSYTIGRTMFETDRLPPDYTQRCNKMEEIWVPTQWSKVRLYKSGLTLCSCPAILA